MILGITGPTGSGKTTLLSLIAEQGGMILDCDRIYHELLSQDALLLQRIEDRFPGTVENGQLQRKKLGERVFSDPQALEALNAVTHSAVRQRVQQLLAQEKPALAAIDAIALFESGLAQLCQVTVAVIAPEDVRVKRLMSRDQVSEEYARKRIGAQHDHSWFAEKCACVLENAGTKAQFQEKCLAFLRGLGIMDLSKPEKE